MHTLSLTLKEVARVQTSFTAASHDPGALARTFYDRLFAIAPGVRPMFPADMAAQERKLAEMLGAAVAGLSDPAALIPAIEGLGRRHAAMGVRTEYFVPVGQALIAALEAHAATHFDQLTRAAWDKVFAWLATIMASAIKSPA